jgi:hypothetical protein
MRLFTRTLLGAATATALVGGGFAVAVATPASGHGASPATCTTIRTTLGGSQGGAGSMYQNIRFTNTGSVGCRLSGHPNVAYVNAHHHLVGWPAAPYMTAHQAGHGSTGTDASPSVVVPPGGAVAATMRIPDYANFPAMDCIKFNAHQIRVMFAGHTTYLKWDETECTSKYARSYIGQVH